MPDMQPDMIPPSVREVARRAASELTTLGIPHVLIGGFAVNAYGYPRATADVDFLVPRPMLSRLNGRPLAEEAGVEGRTVTVTEQGQRIPVDCVAVPRSSAVPAAAWEALFSAARPAGGLPVIPLEGLILLKLLANRTKDQADIVELVKRQGGEAAKRVRGWLRRSLRGEEGRDLLSDYDLLVLTAESEAAGRRNPRQR